jgi:hypothetical protein
MNAKEWDEAMAAREGKTLYRVELTGAELRAVCEAMAASMEKMEARIGKGNLKVNCYSEPEVTKGVVRNAQRQAVRAYNEFWRAECLPLNKVPVEVAG